LDQERFYDQAYEVEDEHEKLSQATDENKEVIEEMIKENKLISQSKTLDYQEEKEIPKAEKPDKQLNVPPAQDTPKKLVTVAGFDQKKKKDF